MPHIVSDIDKTVYIESLLFVSSLLKESSKLYRFCLVHVIDRMNFIITIAIFLCSISQCLTSLTKYDDKISNHVIKMENEGEFFLNIKSVLYSLDLTRIELIRDQDDLIFDSSENDAVKSPDNAITKAFGYIRENRFFGQFQSSGRTFFIDNATKVGLPGTNVILYSLEDIFVNQSSSSQDKERTVELDPNSPRKFIDRLQNNYLILENIQIPIYKS